MAGRIPATLATASYSRTGERSLVYMEPCTVGRANSPTATGESSAKTSFFMSPATLLRHASAVGETPCEATKQSYWSFGKGPGAGRVPLSTSQLSMDL